MTKRMLIDATHPEETRVAVVSGNKLDEYDYETSCRKQLKGNIYLVKVTRVEPSLQAAFVDYGGNRHGFLPFPEIHADYYRIPIADRKALIAEELALAEAEAAKEAAAEININTDSTWDDNTWDENAEIEVELELDTEGNDFEEPSISVLPEEVVREVVTDNQDIDPKLFEKTDEDNQDQEEVSANIEEDNGEKTTKETEVENIGGDVIEPPNFRSNRPKKYTIQEVIKRNQIMLIQISKEERGNKGAAVTSYISLPGRYCVLMPNSPRGGGVSRKVSNLKDRQRLRKILNSLEIPDGMSVILRTAGVARTEAEIRRDLEYLLRLWDQIRELTLKSKAPALIYEEGNLTKRAIRDLYKRDIDEVQVAGRAAFNTAKEFMNTLIPGHVKKLKLYHDETVPLFSRYKVEKQIEEIYSTTVHLKSGGYIVINPTEALVSIDVNSGKATKGRHIEETALKTNLESADEIARQLRLRDQGGLVVIDFIDMEEAKNNRIIERRVKEAMQGDRARIQLGRISPFGLMELSRQRLNPSVVETSFETCIHCEGRGVVRTTESASIIILRAIEEEASNNKVAEVNVKISTDVALYIFNNKRGVLHKIEEKYNVKISLDADNSVLKPNYEIDTVMTPRKGRVKNEKPQPIQTVDMSDFVIEESDISSEDIIEENNNIEEIEDKENQRPTRKRGKRGGKSRGRYRKNNNRNKTENGDNNNNKPSPEKSDVTKPATEAKLSESAKPAKARKGWWKRLTE